MTSTVHDIIISALEEWAESDNELSDVLYEETEAAMHRKQLLRFDPMELHAQVSDLVYEWVKELVKREGRNWHGKTEWIALDNAIIDYRIEKAEVLAFLRKRLEEAK